MQVNFYYSVRVMADGGYEDVGEDGLLTLCGGCARKHSADVQWASRGDDQSECEFCRTSNDPAYSAQLDQLFAEINAYA
jgi:hypothetical protein